MRLQSLYWRRRGNIVHIPSGGRDDVGAIIMPSEEFLPAVLGATGPNQPGGKLTV